VTALLADPNKGWYRVACLGDDVVGQLAVTFEWSDWRCGWMWWLQSVYVRHDARGRGVFRSLYAALLAEAKTVGVVSLRLYVEHDNLAGQRTYQSLGMTPTTYQVFEHVLQPRQEGHKELRI
jgi:GNAT superfamily N-acetyltransferase